MRSFPETDIDPFFSCDLVALHYHSLSIGEGPKADDLKCGFKTVFEKHVNEKVM